MNARLARIYRAIEELASRSAQGPGESGGTGRPAGAASTAGHDEGTGVAGAYRTAVGSNAATAGTDAADRGAGASTGADEGGGEGEGQAHKVAGAATASGRAAEDEGGGTGQGEGRPDIGTGALTAADAEGENVAADDVAGRLAEIWAMIADADPELAKRLPRYLGPSS